MRAPDALEFAPPWKKLLVQKSETREELGTIFLKPQPPHTRQEYEQKYGPKTADFALFWSIWGHILSKFLPCMRVEGVTGVFLRSAHNFGREILGWIIWGAWSPGETRLKDSEVKFAEKFVGNFPKIRQTQIVLLKIEPKSPCRTSGSIHCQSGACPKGSYDNTRF